MHTMELNSSQMDLISSSLDEEGEENGESVNHHARLSFISSLNQYTIRNICFMVIIGIFIFALGSLTGYVAHKKSPSASTDVDSSSEMVETEAELDWNDLTAMLQKNLTTSSIESTLSEFSLDSHQAGSSNEDELGNKVFQKFQGCGMDPWSDTHYVRVQDRPVSGTNRVTFHNKTFDESGFLAYSANGAAQGAVLYAHFGRASDFRQLQELNISTKGRVVLVRAGKISFAEKVATAASVNASAVLIYPDPADYPIDNETALFGHVHLGSGDPYTPGFSSFNHTKFPPAKSSGLPSIPAQTVRASTAATIMREMGGQSSPDGWADGGLRTGNYRLGGDNDIISLEVNNVLNETVINNVFGVIKGLIDPDRYVVIGAQRDAWGPGYAQSTVGTSLLVELARVISGMHKDGFRPRRSIVFASWSAGEYGSVGATEWLEDFLPSLNLKAFSYISLDGVVTGSSFKASASPLMHDLIESTLHEVFSPSDSSKSLYSLFGNNWESTVMEPLRLGDSAYPFQTFSGVPSVSFRFTDRNKPYPYFGTKLDTRKNLGAFVPNVLGLVKAAGEFAGQMALRLVHDHLLRLHTQKYLNVLRQSVFQINKEVTRLQKSIQLSEPLQVHWLSAAINSYSRAASKLIHESENSDLEDQKQCRIINDRIMAVERNLLSAYVSPLEFPFRHIVFGSGSHTLGALHTHLSAIKNGSTGADIDLLRNRLTLAARTIQGCADALAGNVWDTDNQTD
ncbi:transferrin receptor protein 1-like [Trichomycterus rosablanca]|uniref:transferrin receptor protein 1-like n=1 Tax=Trichomycterus rosablanca TaxID=2290929 RepID=UPI002F35215B